MYVTNCFHLFFNLFQTLKESNWTVQFITFLLWYFCGREALQFSLYFLPVFELFNYLYLFQFINSNFCFFLNFQTQTILSTFAFVLFLIPCIYFAWPLFNYFYLYLFISLYYVIKTFIIHIALFVFINYVCFDRATLPHLLPHPFYCHSPLLPHTPLRLWDNCLLGRCARVRLLTTLLLPLMLITMLCYAKHITLIIIDIAKLSPLNDSSVFVWHSWIVNY